jgi:hypothetical protein
VTIGNELTLLLAGVAFASTAQCITDGARRIDPLMGLDISRDLNFQRGPRRPG